MGFKHRTSRRAEITADDVRRILNYDPLTGAFTWKTRPGRRCIIGASAVAVQKGRNTIKLGTGRFPASHVAWLYVHGIWPTLEIDHRDRNKLNDAFDNLRETSTMKNMMNMTKTKRNTSGFKGVWKWREVYRAGIRADGYRYDLGEYPTAELAAGAYRIAAAGMHAEYSGI